MPEYIDRGAAMRAFADRVWDSNHSDFASVPEWNDAVAIVENIPAADVRPTNPAEWIEDGYQGLPCVCSYCGEPGKRDWRFCPYCGATMKVAQDPAPDPKSTFYDLLYEEGGANTT